ncbi:MAG: hypothetical protein GY856_09220 [bacterium]|nr:hypothetical protein [bacterium]
MRRSTTYSVKTWWTEGWRKGARAGLALLVLLTAAVGVTGPSAAAGGPQGFPQLTRPVRAQPTGTEDCGWTALNSDDGLVVSGV